MTLRTALPLALLLVCTQAHAGKHKHKHDQGDSSEPFAANEKRQVIPTRPGVTLAFDLISTEGSAAKTCAILLPGGQGKLALDDEGFGSGATNFLVRARQLFSKQQFSVAVMDAPSDHADGLDEFRTSDAHAQDLRALIGWLHEHNHCSVWLVGTSRGTISAANVVARTGAENVAGLVLTSSVTTGKKESLADVAVEKISVPVLLVHHHDDGCNSSPLEGAKSLRERLHASSRKDLQVVRGGESTGHDECGGQSHHGYQGQDDEVVRLIANWINAG